MAIMESELNLLNGVVDNSAYADELFKKRNLNWLV